MPPRGVPSSASQVQFGGSSTAHWGGVRTPGEGGAGGGGGNTYIAHGCFEDNGEVLCFCNTQPRIKATRRVTRKESSPNLGREFWTCGNWVEGEGCKFFLWCDEAASKGRRYRTPPPPGSTVQPPASPQKRSCPTTPPSKPDSSACPTPVSSAAAAAPENFDDIDFDALDAAVEDDIEDSYEEELPTQYTQTGSQRSQLQLSSPSPSKKPRFASFSSAAEADGAGPSTPTKPFTSGAAATARGGFAAIQNDPESPFHAIQRNLFGPGSTPAPPSSSFSAVPPSSPLKTPAHSLAGIDDPFFALSTAFSSLPSLLDSVKRDKDRDGRLLAAAKKKEEALKKQALKEKEARERVERDNEGLKERIRMLEEEVNELRTRSR
ncbi:hypothetical protein JCM11641_000998 [Rhodosporidiobolus odoratus]